MVVGEQSFFIDEKVLFSEIFACEQTLVIHEKTGAIRQHSFCCSRVSKHVIHENSPPPKNELIKVKYFLQFMLILIFYILNIYIIL